ncbi:serine protease HTR4 [Schistocerca nitens]|uniref:serine protease HTR4 n=1 Tax=Schistocerca nitens TaxID=7011 RepID=UPI0021188642|nr:serine protease HTR4 [Schistocerca nitens]
MRSRLQLQVVLAVLAAPAWAALLVAAPGPACVCSPAECEPVSAAECPGGAGTVWDACGCCRVCARAEAQPCGGPYGFYGSCGPGLLCVLQPGRPPLRSADGVCTRRPCDVNRHLAVIDCHFLSAAVVCCGMVGNRCARHAGSRTFCLRCSREGFLLFLDRRAGQRQTARQVRGGGSEEGGRLPQFANNTDFKYYPRVSK